MPHGITQCYLPPGRGDIPALTPAEAGTRLSDPGWMKGRVELGVCAQVSVFLLVAMSVECCLAVSRPYRLSCLTLNNSPGTAPS